jgi:hypothetical protein
MSFIRPPLLLLAVVATLLSHVAIANTSYDYGIDRSTILKRQDSSFYAITGVHTSADPDISTAIRHEIRSLEQDNITWTLYILGLDMLQYTNQTEMLSWYQIAGTSSVLFLKSFFWLTSSQAFMDDPTNPSMAWNPHPATRIMDTARTFPSSSPRGIVHISRSMSKFCTD